MSENIYQNICEICHLLIDDQIDLVEGCRQIYSLLNENNLEHEKDFSSFCSFYWQIDDYPEKEIRHRFSDEYLEKLDKEVDSFKSEMKPSILHDCKKIIEKYS